MRLGREPRSEGRVSQDVVGGIPGTAGLAELTTSAPVRRDTPLIEGGRSFVNVRFSLSVARRRDASSSIGHQDVQAIRGVRRGGSVSAALARLRDGLSGKSLSDRAREPASGYPPRIPPPPGNAETAGSAEDPSSRRYVPEGHTERMQELHSKWRKAIEEAESIGSRIPGDIREAIWLSLDDGESTEYRKGKYGAYRRALQEDNRYRMEVHHEKERAIEFLKALAAPYLAEPKEDERGSIHIKEGSVTRPVTVPFDSDEMEAIAKAEESYLYLRRDAAVGSGYGREFAMDTMSWPWGTRLLQRDKAVWGIFLTAQYAEGELLRDHDTRGITPDMIPHLTRLFELPDRLVQHTTQSGSQTP